ncbi:protein LONGIFOLIA 1-like [Phragmites australis]|uniref:protein LONGIFOLIA 1-like n=1 Tax=Phragmites australis TaxID=29695 RepID=UPI002D790D70|nr:protein LONGIFOLIA 1-like [Phragmites australis]
MPARMHGGDFSDDMPEFDRQMGCMAGIFQIFDRQRLITGRRGGRQAQKRLPPPPGNTLPKSSSNVPVQSSSTSKIILEKTFSKCTTENSSLSIESSRASSSSSSCSSFSSLDGNKSVQHELPYINEELFVQSSLKSSPSLKGTDMNTKPGHPNVGFRDIVKDSINRDSGGLTVKTSVQEARRNGQYKDSPRPLLLSKSMDGTYVIGIDRSTKVPAHVTESGRRFQEQSRFSCDDRRLLRSAETQESKRPSTRLKELPRLSLDSRKESLSPSSRLKNSSYKRTDDTLLDALKPQDSPSHRRANSVIAKLMGLEEATIATGVLIAGDYDPSKSPRPVQVTQNEQPSRSPRSTCQDSCVLQLKNESSVLKTKPSPRILTEAAPWRQQERGATNIKAPQFREAEVRPRTESVYAAIERRLGGLEFLECNKDFRALRILGALHAKDVKRQNDSNARPVAVQRTGYHRTTNSGNFQPPIVVMKPARITGESGVSFSSVAPIAGLRIFRKLPPRELPLTGKNETGSNEKNHSRIARAQSKSEEPASSASSPRPTGSSSPRLMQKKAESERRSRPPVSPKSPSNKPNEAASPRGRTRSKPSQVKSHRDNEVLQSKGSRISLAKQVDVSIMDCPKALDVSPSFVRPSNTAATASHKGPSILGSDHNIHSLDNIPSPVSVLDTSFYHKRISDSFTDCETHSSDECWNLNSLPDTPQSKTSSEVSQIKPENLEALIQKLEQLQSMNDEAAKAKELMTSSTANKDHQYIYEILVVSGLLHKELTFAAIPGQLRPSSYPINPELFLILEQTKPDFVSTIQAFSVTKKSSKPYAGKLHRRLVFDLVNEIIAQKMNICGSATRSVKFLQSRKLSGWQLFKDLCTEVDRLIKCSEEDEDENIEGALNGTEDWGSFDTELNDMVLDIERSIFKDLIDEVVGGDAAEKMHFGQWKLRRQLSFSSALGACVPDADTLLAELAWNAQALSGLPCARARPRKHFAEHMWNMVLLRIDRPRPPKPLAPSAPRLSLRYLELRRLSSSTSPARPPVRYCSRRRLASLGFPAPSQAAASSWGGAVSVPSRSEAMAMQAGSSAALYSPHVVGGAFIKQYYETLCNSPEHAHRFYDDSSKLGRADSDGNMTTVTTMHDVNVQLLSTDFTDCLIELETVDSQSSHGGGVLILVTGSFTTPDAVKQKFTQSFFLAPQGNGGYFVLNDMFRFVSARPSTEINEVIACHDIESAQSATLPAEPETGSVKESTVPDLPSTENMPVNDEVISPSANGDSPDKNDAGVETCVKEVNEGVEKIPEAAPTTASVEKDVTKKTYASIVKVMRESTPSAPAAKPKPRPKTAQSVSSPPKPAHATNTALAIDKNISKNKSHDEPGYSIYVKNLPFNATVEMVEHEFKKFGAIKPGGIQVRNRQPDRFCFGFVEFESQHSMQAAIEASPVYFGLRESHVEEKRTTTRVVNGVITRGNDNGNAGGSRFQSGRGGYHGDNFIGQGTGFVNNGNYHDGNNKRNDYRNQNEYPGLGRGPQGNGYPQDRNGYHQDRNGYRQNGNGYPQNGNGYQQRRPSHNGNGNGPNQTKAAA